MFSKGWHEHLEWLRMFFLRLREANQLLGPRKCTLAKRSVTFLGHHVSEDGLRPDPRLLESISKIPIPSTVTQVRSFLGLVGYYQRFILGFSKIVAPLNRLLEKNRSFHFNRGVHPSFPRIKSSPTKRTNSSIPRFYCPILAIH